MIQFRWRVNNRGATIEIADTEVTVFSDDGTRWEFTENLRPSSVATGSTGVSFLFDNDGRIYSTPIGMGGDTASRTETTRNNPHLQSFGDALDALQTASEQNLLPEWVRDKLPGAYAALGIKRRENPGNGGRFK